MANYVFIESEHKNHHVISEGAPCEWSKVRGATHTLHIDKDSTCRPAKIKKTRIYVGVDELPGEVIKWETWKGRWTENIKGEKPFN